MLGWWWLREAQALWLVSVGCAWCTKLNSWQIFPRSRQRLVHKYFIQYCEYTIWTKITVQFCPFDLPEVRVWIISRITDSWACCVVPTNIIYIFHLLRSFYSRSSEIQMCCVSDFRSFSDSNPCFPSCNQEENYDFSGAKTRLIMTFLVKRICHNDKIKNKSWTLVEMKQMYLLCHKFEFVFQFAVLFNGLKKTRLAKLFVTLETRIESFVYSL